MKYIKTFNESTLNKGENSALNGNDDLGIWKKTGEKFWMGLADIEGNIVEVKPYDICKKGDFHLEFSFTEENVKKYNDDELICFWFDDPISLSYDYKHLVFTNALQKSYKKNDK